MRPSLRWYLSHVTKRLDEDEYVPCCNERERTLCRKSLHVVLRKNRTEAFKRHAYTYKFTDFSLRDIVVPSDKGRTGTTCSLLSEDASLIDVHWPMFGQTAHTSVFTPREAVDASLSFNTSAGFADLKFREANKLDGIIQELQTRWCFDRTHKLWKFVSNTTEKYKLAVITGVVLTGTRTDTKLKQHAKSSFELSLKELVKVYWSYWKEIMRRLQIHEGTVLAYKVQPLEVHPTSGQIRLPVRTMSDAGDFAMTILSINPEKEIDFCRLYYSKYCGQLSKEKQVVLRKAVKELLPSSLLPTYKSTDKLEEFVQRKDTDEGNNSFFSGDESRIIGRLVHLKKLAKVALPTMHDAKEKEMADLWQELGVAGLLDVTQECDVVYGIRYLLTALLCLPIESLPWLGSCANEGDEHNASQAVTELERLLHCVAEWQKYSVKEVAPNVQTFLSLALLEDEESFLYAWRAAYVSAIYLCGLPVTAATA